MILFDTDICIEILRGNKKILKRRSEYPGEVGITFMTVAELFYGAENSAYATENRLLVERFILSILVVHTDISILKRFGAIKADLKKESQLLPDADIFIASTTLEKAEALITGNTKHFERIGGLKINNWLK